MAPYTCNSPWQNPDEMGETRVTFDGNFTKKSAMVRERDIVSSKRPSQEFIGNEPRLYIYPNPSNGNVWVEAEDLRGFQKIILHNIDGRKVWEESYDFDTNASYALDLSAQPKGLYVITVFDSHNATYHNQKLMLK